MAASGPPPRRAAAGRPPSVRNRRPGRGGGQDVGSVPQRPPGGGGGLPHPAARSHGGAISSALALPLKPPCYRRSPRLAPHRAAAGGRRVPVSPPPAQPTERPSRRRSWGVATAGEGAGEGVAGYSAKNKPLLIKRWGPGLGAALPAPYKYAPCAARGLWPARLCRRRGAAERSESAEGPPLPPPPPGEPGPPARCPG